MSHGHGQFRNMGNFKALALDYEFWLSNGTEGALYCLDQRDISILLALSEYVGWFTRWINTDDTSPAEIRAIQGELTLKLMSCVDISILIEQAKLTANYEATNQQVQSEGLRQILMDRYDGTPTSINPSAPTTNFGDSGDRFDALCASITAFVYKFAANQANVIRLNEIGGAAAIALIAALLIPGLNVFLIVGASVAVLLGFGVVGVSSEVAIAALTDQTALGDVICFMRDRLKAQSVTEAHWNACLNTYPFAVGSHQAIVADFIKAALADNYLTVLNMLGQGYDSVLAGDELPECPCSPGGAGFIIFGDVATTTVNRVGNTYTFVGGYITGGGTAFMYFQSSTDAVYGNNPMTFTGLSITGVSGHDWGNGGASYTSVPPTSAPPPDVSYAGGYAPGGSRGGMTIVVTTTLPFQGILQGGG